MSKISTFLIFKIAKILWRQNPVGLPYIVLRSLWFLVSHPSHLTIPLLFTRKSENFYKKAFFCLKNVIDPNSIEVYNMK
jgi:hypothetical protein